MWNHQSLLLLICVVMGTEEKPLNPLVSNHDDSAPSSNQVHRHTYGNTHMQVWFWFQWFLIFEWMICVCKSSCGFDVFLELNQKD